MTRVVSTTAIFEMVKGYVQESKATFKLLYQSPLSGLKIRSLTRGLGLNKKL